MKHKVDDDHNIPLVDIEENSLDVSIEEEEKVEIA